MYSNGQIVYDLDKKEPIQVGSTADHSDWAWSNLPKRTTHFIISTGKFTRDTTEYKVFCPKTTEEAIDLLNKNIISPAPISPTHCWKCRNWWDNHTENNPCKEKPRG